MGGRDPTPQWGEGRAEGTPKRGVFLYFQWEAPFFCTQNDPPQKKVPQSPLPQRVVVWLPTSNPLLPGSQKTLPPVPQALRASHRNKSFHWC